MPAISVRLETRSSAKTGGEWMHNERLNDAPIYIAPERTCDNSVLIPMPTAVALSRECLRRRAAFEPGPAPSGNPKRMPQGMAANAVISVAGLITFSTDAQPEFEALPSDEQNKRFMEASAAVAAQYNTDVVALAVHRDESAAQYNTDVVALVVHRDESAAPHTRILRCPDSTMAAAQSAKK